MTPVKFALKWTGSTQTERAAAQEHFIDLCRLLGVPTPNEADPTGRDYAWLDRAHARLDQAVHAAYEWPYPLRDEEILERLIDLNLSRSEGQGEVASAEYPA